METFSDATDYRGPTEAAMRVRNYVRAFAHAGREGGAMALVDTLDGVTLDVRDLDALVDAVDHGAGRVPVNRTHADLRELVASAVDAWTSMSPDERTTARCLSEDLYNTLGALSTAHSVGRT